MRRIWMPVSIILIVVLLASTTVLAALYATKPTRAEVLAGLTPAQAATMSVLAPILAFSPEDVPGEVGGEPFIDDLGREVFIPGSSPVERIVDLHPAATETLFYLDADDKLIAVSNAWSGDPFAPDPVESWILTPEDVDNEIERRVSAEELIALNAFAVSPEVILDLEPDVVFVFGYTFPDYAAAIEDEVPVICFAPRSLKDVLYDIAVIGKIADREQEMISLIDEIKAQFIEIAGMTLTQSRPKVFCETGYWWGTVYTTGEGSFVSSLITLAGGKDIGAAVPVANPVISSEYVAGSGTEIIILLDAANEANPWGETAESVAGRDGWSTIPAVINGKIYELDAESVDEITRPGPRITEGLEVLLEIIHPELSL